MFLDIIACLLALPLLVFCSRSIKGRSIYCFGQVWESSAMHRQALRIQAGDRVMSVAGAGDVAFAFLLDDPARVVGVDISPDQIHLCELKKVGIEQLNREECLKLLGYDLSGHSPAGRLDAYRKIREYLQNDTRSYWDERLDVIERGVINCGVLGELAIHFVGKNILPWFLNKGDAYRMLEADVGEREKLISQCGCQRFLPKFFVRIAYAWTYWMVTFVDSHFQYHSSYLLVSPVTFIYKMSSVIGRLISIYTTVCLNGEKALRHVPTRQSFLQEYILTGDISGKFGLPEYLQREKFETIKSRIGKISFMVADIYDLEKLGNVIELSGGAIDAINLSNVPQFGTGPAARNNVHELFKNMISISKPGTRAVFLALQHELTWPRDLKGKVGGGYATFTAETEIARKAYEEHLIYSPYVGYRVAKLAPVS